MIMLHISICEEFFILDIVDFHTTFLVTAQKECWNGNGNACNHAM